MNIEIIKAPTKEKPFLVIYKPKGLASAPLKEDDNENALAQAISLYPEICLVQGKKNIEYGLLHRLDTATDGLMVIATSQEAYDFLSNEQSQGRFIKYYSAECDIIPDNAELLTGFPPLSPKMIYDFKNQTSQKILATSFFRPYGQGRKEVRPVTEESGKAALSKLGKEKKYTTEITINLLDSKKALAECCIKEGYRHQVRCHLAWLGFPVAGDSLYNASEKVAQCDSDIKKAEKLLKFSATKISFEYPRGDLNSYDRKDTWT